MRTETRAGWRRLQIIAGLACACLLIAGSSALAGSMETVTGEYTYQYGDNESLNDAKQTCKDMALRQALESALVYLKSEAQIGETGLDKLDIRSVSEGCLEDVEVLEKTVNGKTIYYRLQATVDMAALGSRLKAHYRISPEKSYKIAFYNGAIKEGLPCEKDDPINAAPDVSLRVLDKHGNEVFHSGQKFLHDRRMKPFLKNRNSYTPEFNGISFVYTFANEEDYLDVQLIDFDGLEGVLGNKSSQDDIIGDAYRISTNQFIGKRWVKNEAWKLEIELMPCEDKPTETDAQ